MEIKKKNIPDELKEWTNPENKWGTDKLPIGGTVPFHTAWGFQTGDWSAFKPFINQETCTGCLDCFFYCPDRRGMTADNSLWALCNSGGENCSHLPRIDSTLRFL